MKTIQQIENEIHEKGYSEVMSIAENGYPFTIKKSGVGYSVTCDFLEMENVTSTDYFENGFSKESTLEEVLRYMDADIY